MPRARALFSIPHSVNSVDMFLPTFLRVVPCSVKPLTHRITIALRCAMIANKDGNQYSALAIIVRHIAQRDTPRVENRKSTPRRWGDGDGEKWREILTKFQSTRTFLSYWTTLNAPRKSLSQNDMLSSGRKHFEYKIDFDWFRSSLFLFISTLNPLSHVRAIGQIRKISIFQLKISSEESIGYKWWSIEVRLCPEDQVKFAHQTLLCLAMTTGQLNIDVQPSLWNCIRKYSWSVSSRLRFQQKG